MIWRSFLFPACFAVILLAFAAPGQAASGSPEALVKAVREGDLASVQKLLDAGASPDSRDEKGVPALSLAASRRNAAVVKLLLSKGADVHALASPTEKVTDVPVIWYAACQGSAEVLRLILQAGASLKEHDGQGTTPLMIAAFMGNMETLPVLLSLQADVNARDAEARTPLMWAADGGQYEAARLLLDAGAEVDALGELKSPALMYAAQHGFDDVVALLVERGADVSRRATPGLTALDLAKQNKHTLTIDLLTAGGRQKPPVPEFDTYRRLLYPESPLETMFLTAKADDESFEAIRQSVVKGELRLARRLLDAGRETLQGQPRYWWTLAHVQQQLGDRVGVSASLRKILAAPNVSSRQTLRAWKLLRELGEAPPAEIAKRVLGVVVESGSGAAVLVVAAYADGQPRYFLSYGGGVIGERWTDEEKQKDKEIVSLAQELLEGMAPSEDRSLPKPGRVRFIFLTPAGSYEAEESLAFLNQWNGHYVKVFAASDQLLGLLVKHVADHKAEKDH
ncbi:MAG TPA: ankyrin repeat domain-containing protein [Thermoanaerobaculia bacterium]|nr:ankyrin repeat domain-containing protein [Thermoanaerobaculia bacterium]